ncbi:hypothetical protein GGTG_04724 [Gaeumannomyces tritici R3-111a-1]|uniref:Uncharacterized protein n=1 Tax=Gaeumannomyces tritici (strain R3-111a-1) TaxID=644352 RepID=J3NTX5_GAET3|nr:hypothetical protein GGTG_04724 [Gaeumannomyces tritici R3-111a-1]EJT79640.1 hypothetical protein GGTG_04724 [Gaeumannomyces tritici R3-111a-1]
MRKLYFLINTIYCRKEALSINIKCLRHRKSGSLAWKRITLPGVRKEAYYKPGDF